MIKANISKIIVEFRDQSPVAIRTPGIALEQKTIENHIDCEIANALEQKMIPLRRAGAETTSPGPTWRKPSKPT
jgi:hypothetical protein